jgi:glycosyltransferase involved in cell wall biosynthesis
MKVLFVSSGNSGEISTFTKEQAESIRKLGVSVDFFLVKGRGVLGYLKNISVLNKILSNDKYDLIHAHYGLSGVLAILQRICPVVVTYHGCDINRRVLKIFSKISIELSSFNIFVSEKLAIKAKIKERYCVIPCGVNLNTFFYLDKDFCRRKMKLGVEKKIVLFSSSFSDSAKNFNLAIQAVNILGDLSLIELKGYKREEVNLLINACDLLLMTSIREGSPQVIKEAMACNCPIVSTDVGDVKEVIGNTEGCYITSYDPKDVAKKIKMAIEFDKRTNGRQNIQHLELSVIGNKVIDVYKKVLG